ncbi:preprotein translocase subunit SecG [Paracrocinitomix mangrovi]|uniref:preprotein translocase subunit SecG n=1 Tax=Paracrocinitomix mangrovi TaxID=2862509 RepID=UPI001C8EB8BA|nr:preprotein translocase subunit SecG [Paracrocinitomix mangrovi]UKN03295.1 preprotein translocase subunit SecG [Paracrocinitomix mangrovi]
MDSLLTILVIIGCVGLILFVLIQNPKGGGLNSEFGSAVQLGGAKRATDILEKGTWGLAIGIALICLVWVKPANNSTENNGIQGDPDMEIQDNSGAGDNQNFTPTQIPGGGMPNGGGAPQ